MASNARPAIDFESQALLVQRQRLINRFADGPKAVLGLLRQCEIQIRIESEKEPDSRMSRARRQVFLARRNEILSRFRSYADSLRMTIEEFNARLSLYYRNRQINLSRAAFFLQPLEACLSTKTEKMRRRMEGYTKELVDSLFEENASSRGSYWKLFSEKIWYMHTFIRECVDCQSIPPVNALMALLPSIESEAPLSLFEIMYLVQFLQLMQLLCSRSADGLNGVGSLDADAMHLRSGNILKLHHNKKETRLELPQPRRTDSQGSITGAVKSISVISLAARCTATAFCTLRSLMQNIGKASTPALSEVIVENGQQRQFTSGVRANLATVTTVLVTQTFQTLRAILQTSEAFDRCTDRSCFLVQTPRPKVATTFASPADNTTSSSAANSQLLRLHRTQSTNPGLIRGQSTAMTRSYSSKSDHPEVNRSSSRDDIKGTLLSGVQRSPSCDAQQRDYGKSSPTVALSVAANIQGFTPGDSDTGMLSTRQSTTIPTTGRPSVRKGISKGVSIHPAVDDEGAINDDENNRLGKGEMGKPQRLRSPMSTLRSSKPSFRSEDGLDEDRGQQQTKFDEKDESFWGENYDSAALAVDIVMWLRIIVAIKSGGGVFLRTAGKLHNGSDNNFVGSTDATGFLHMLSLLEVEAVTIGSTFVTDVMVCANRLIRLLVTTYDELAIAAKDEAMTAAIEEAAASVNWRSRQSVIRRRSITAQRDAHKPYFEVLSQSCAYPFFRDLVKTSCDLGFVVSDEVLTFLAPNRETYYPLIGDPLMMQAVSWETTEALRLVAAAVSGGFFTYSALATMMIGAKLVQHRVLDYFLAHAWLQILHGAIASMVFGDSRNMEDSFDPINGTLDFRGNDIFPYVSSGCCRAAEPCPAYDILANILIQRTLASITTTTLQQSLHTFFGANISVVFFVMSIHRMSVTIQHAGLILLRLITREAFMTHAELDDFIGLESPNDYLKDIREEEDDDKDNDNNDDDKAIGTTQRRGLLEKKKSVARIPSTQGGATTGKVTSKSHGGKTNLVQVLSSTAAASSAPAVTTEGDEHEISDAWSIGKNTGADESVLTDDFYAETKIYFNTWKQAAVEKSFRAYHDTGYKDLSFSEMLTFIGETHLLSDELVEQYLLLVHQLTGTSTVCKLSLVESGVAQSVARILDEKQEVKNAYLIALCEICLEELKIVETATPSRTSYF